MKTQDTGALYVEPVIHEHEDNTDRVIDYLDAECERLKRSVCTRWLGVPIVVHPGSEQGYVLDAWKRDYERLTQAQAQEHAQRWYHNRFVQVLLVIIACFIATLAYIGAVSVYAGPDSAGVATYDDKDASLTINFTTWKKQLACSDGYYLHLDQNPVPDSGFGGIAYKYVPYCSTTISAIDWQPLPPATDPSEVTWDAGVQGSEAK